MRILLLYPAFLHERAVEENLAALPSGLYWLAAALEATGCEVELADLHDLPPAAVEQVLRGVKPDLIGVSILHENRWGGIDAARLARRLYPDVPIIFGGVGATFLAEHLLAHVPEIDAVVCGEGEETMVELARAVEAGRRDFSDITGLALCGPDGSVIHTPPRPPADLAALADCCDPSRRYTFQHLSLTRGCPGNCRFCGSPGFWGRRVRFLPTSAFVDQLERLYARGLRFFYISDDTFTVSRAKVLEVCAAIRERFQDRPSGGREITWAAITRVEQFDAEIARAMRLAGCIQVSFGVESGSSAVRERLGKRLDDSEILSAFAAARRAGILPRAYLIYGCPGESEADLAANLAFMDAAKPLVVLYHVLAVFPGTALWQEARERFGLTDDVWLERIEDLLWLDLDPELDQTEVRRWGAAMKSHFLAGLPGYVRSLAGELDPDPELARPHADFLSRLGMTLLTGDYAREPAIPHREELAGWCFQQALERAPHPRAHLGLGLLAHMGRRGPEALEHFLRGAELAPTDADLRLYAGVSLLHAGRPREAMAHLEAISRDPRAAGYLDACRRQLG